MINRYKDLEKIEEDLAKAKGDLSDLTHYRQIVLAQETLIALEKGSKSVAAADLIARNSEQYRDVVKALAAITEKEAILWMQYRRKARELGI